MKLRFASHQGTRCGVCLFLCHWRDRGTAKGRAKPFRLTAGQKRSSTFKPATEKLTGQLQTEEIELEKYTTSVHFRLVPIVVPFYTPDTNHTQHHIKAFVLCLLWLYHVNISLPYTSAVTGWPFRAACWFTASVDGQGGWTLSLLGFLEQLYTVVAVEFHSPPVSVVGDQQGAELQTALTVSFSRHPQLRDVLHQVGLNSCPLCLRPRPLHHTTFTWDREDVC